jgi:hypothetical protein
MAPRIDIASRAWGSPGWTAAGGLAPAVPTSPPRGSIRGRVCRAGIAHAAGAVISVGTKISARAAAVCSVTGALLAFTRASSLFVLPVFEGTKSSRRRAVGGRAGGDRTPAPSQPMEPAYALRRSSHNIPRRSREARHFRCPSRSTVMRDDAEALSRRGIPLTVRYEREGMVTPAARSGAAGTLRRRLRGR